MNCFPTEAFLVVTEASQTLDTNTGHIKWDCQGLTAANWQPFPDGLDPSRPNPCSQSTTFMFQEILATIPTNPSLPISYWLGPSLFFSLLGMCVCGMQERGCEYSNVWVHVPARTPAQMCTCTESPVFCYGPPRYSLSWGSLRWTQNSPIQLVLESQLALPPPSEPQVTTMPNSLLHRAGVLNTSSHVYTASVLTPAPPPSLLLRHFFTYHWTIQLRILELVSHPPPFFFQLAPYFSCRQGGSLNRHHQSFPEKHQHPHCL